MKNLLRPLLLIFYLNPEVIYYIDYRAGWLQVCTMQLRRAFWRNSLKMNFGPIMKSTNEKTEKSGQDFGRHLFLWFSRFPPSLSLCPKQKQRPQLSQYCSGKQL